MVEGMLTKNVNLVKAASRATLFPLAFARCLQEVDDTGGVAGSFAVLSWSGKGSQVHRAIMFYCESCAQRQFCIGSASNRYQAITQNF